jgi:hypothetical protein
MGDDVAQENAAKFVNDDFAFMTGNRYAIGGRGVVSDSLEDVIQFAESIPSVSYGYADGGPGVYVRKHSVITAEVDFGDYESTVELLCVLGEE